MQYQYVPYVWPLLASGVVTLGLAVYALWHRNVRGALPFGLCMLLASLWSVSSALERAGADLPTMLFWANLQYISYTVCPVLWLIMVFLFVERDRWVTARNIALLLVLPATTMIILWTGDPYSLIRQNIFLATSGIHAVVGKTYGPWFWLILGYADLLNIISMVLMGWTLRRKSLLYRRQVLVLFIGLGLVILQNIAYLCGIYPARYLDMTPVVMGVSGIIITWGIFSFRLFDIVPVARENIIENMTDGLVVLDGRNRIADINLTAKNIFAGMSAQPVKQDARVFFHDWPAFALSGFDPVKLPREMAIEKDGHRRVYEVSCSPLCDRWGKRSGMTLVFHDVTEQRESQGKLLEQQRELAVSEERDRMARDLHDDLGQVFGFINVQAQAIKKQMSDAGVDVDSNKIDRLIDVTQSAHQKMREYIHSVKNVKVEGDFASALKQEAGRIGREAGLVVSLDISDAPTIESLKPDVRQHMLSVVKEALNNIQKHAGAKNVSIVIRSDGTDIRVTISDDGRGFDLAQLKNKPLQGLGLNIMKERAVEIGGELSVDTTPAKGTQVILRVPLHR